jgi:hypothetical protein
MSDEADKAIKAYQEGKGKDYFDDKDRLANKFTNH